MKRLKVLNGQHVTGRVVIWAVSFAIFHSLIALAMLLNPESFHHASVLYKYNLSLASLEVWSFGYAFPAMLFIGAALTRRFVLWLLGIFFSIVVSASWFLCLVIGALGGSGATIPGIALWGWFLIAHAMVATYPYQVEKRGGTQ